MEKMMSKRELYGAIVNGVEITEEMRDKARECINALDRAAEKAKSREKKPTPKQMETAKANEALAERVYQAMVGVDEPMTASDVFGLGIEGVTSVHKASYLLRRLVSEGRATVEDVKVDKRTQKGYHVA